MDILKIKPKRKSQEGEPVSRRLVWTSLTLGGAAALLVFLLLTVGGESPAGQDIGRCWLEAGYKRDVEAEERKRDAEFDEGRVLDIVGVKAGMTLGEVGAGNGYFTLKLAGRVGPSGRIYANDILGSALAELQDRAYRQNLFNIMTILGTETDPRLPPGKLDMVFLVRAFHDLSEPVVMLDRIAASLKPGGKIVIVEIEYEAHDGKSTRPMTRRQYLDILAGTRLTVERIDKSLPHPGSLVLVLAPK